MHTVFALLCFVVVIHWLIFPYPSGLLHWHCGNVTIAPVPAKQPWWIWINTSCEFIMNDCITTTNQSTTKPCAYFLGYTVRHRVISDMNSWSHRSSVRVWSGASKARMVRWGGVSCIIRFVESLYPAMIIYNDWCSRQNGWREQTTIWNAFFLKVTLLQWLLSGRTVKLINSKWVGKIMNHQFKIDKSWLSN